MHDKKIRVYSQKGFESLVLGIEHEVDGVDTRGFVGLATN